MTKIALCYFIHPSKLSNNNVCSVATQIYQFKFMRSNSVNSVSFDRKKMYRPDSSLFKFLFAKLHDRLDFSMFTGTRIWNWKMTDSSISNIGLVSMIYETNEPRVHIHFPWILCDKIYNLYVHIQWICKYITSHYAQYVNILWSIFNDV